MQECWHHAAKQAKHTIIKRFTASSYGQANAHSYTLSYSFAKAWRLHISSLCKAMLIDILLAAKAESLI